MDEKVALYNKKEVEMEKRQEQVRLEQSGLKAAADKALAVKMDELESKITEYRNRDSDFTKKWIALEQGTTNLDKYKQKLQEDSAQKEIDLKKTKDEVDEQKKAIKTKENRLDDVKKKAQKEVADLDSEHRKTLAKLNQMMI